MKTPCPCLGFEPTTANLTLTELSACGVLAGSAENHGGFPLNIT